jgi:hypothetical protein
MLLNRFYRRSVEHWAARKAAYVNGLTETANIASAIVLIAAAGRVCELTHTGHIVMGLSPIQAPTPRAPGVEGRR